MTCVSSQAELLPDRLVKRSIGYLMTMGCTLCIGLKAPGEKSIREWLSLMPPSGKMQVWHMRYFPVAYRSAFSFMSILACARDSASLRLTGMLLVALAHAITNAGCPWSTCYKNDAFSTAGSTNTSAIPE